MSQEEISVPKGWELKTLFDVTVSHDGKRIPLNKSQRSQIQGKYPYYGASGQVDSINDYKFDGKFMLLAEDGENLNSRKKPIAFIVEGKFWVNNHAHVLESTKEILIDYLCYYINSLNIMKFAQKQSTRPKLNKTDMNKIPIPIPNTSIQKQIVAKLDHILGELDTKKKQILSLIEQNKQRIDFFEKNWFKFLILKEFEKFSKLPEWKLEKLMTVTTIGQGGTPSRSNLDYWNGDIPWLSSGEMRNNIITNSKEKITKLGLEKSSTKLCPIGTVMIAMTGQGLTRGRTSLLQIEACANQSCAHIIIQDQNNLLPEFLWFYLQSQYWKIRSVHHGSGQPGINTSTIKSWNIPLPPIQTQKEIVKNIKNAEEKFQLHKKQFENIKKNYESKINYINHIQTSVLDSAFSGKLVQ